MRISDDLLAVELPFEFGGIPGHLFIPVILHQDGGVTLVDTGTPGSLPAIRDELNAAGRDLRDVRTVLITHHDPDHIGSLADVVEASGAQVLSDPREIPYVEGTLPPQKVIVMDPRFGPVQHHKVSRALQPGEVLPVAGGVRAVPTPGHTFGHTAYFLERGGILLTGDSFSVDAGAGRLLGPAPHVTPDLGPAHRSLRVMAELPVQAILGYHGGLLARDAREQLAQLAGDLAPA
ncbi:MAG TPA: MBL fold metallo-hydrolase [Deinococcales bacterium]|nr:MBL fold metallo-hydrolase [Deinococcales bacterium]